MKYRNAHLLFQLVAMIAVMLLAGCSASRATPAREKSPRPVTIMTLQVTDPSRLKRLTGVAGSWKTQELSFEVAGRVQYVAEPETDVEGRIYAADPVSTGTSGITAPDRTPLSPGTQLARIDPTRYQLKVASVKAQIDTIVQQSNALQVELDEVIPAERGSAEAELRFQEAELARIAPLVASGAVTKSDFERVQADRDKAKAALLQIDASKSAKQAEIKALEAQILEAEQSLADAHRNVEECTIFSPFRGQIASVDVIPGAYVNAGQSVLTVQMMDPIKIELEVSADESRRLTYKDAVDVVVSTVDRDTHANAVVYTIDPVADPNTRTFTVTLLMANQKISMPVPAELAGKPFARTRDTWRFFKDRFVGRDLWMTEVNSIHEDEAGAYVWKIKNGQQAGGVDDRVLQVAKIRVLPGELRVPFLDIWTFREVRVAAGQDFDPDQDLIAGKLELPPAMADGFDGGPILFDRPQWMLRPGDLVAVNLSGAPLPPGFYVPIGTISEQSGQYFVHVVDAGVVRRVEVEVFETVDTSRRIEPVTEGALTEGTALVARGTHFLVDGEAVLVTGDVR